MKKEYELGEDEILEVKSDRLFHDMFNEHEMDTIEWMVSQILDCDINDIHGNACIGQDILLYDSSNCIVHTLNVKEVVVQGLDGFIVVEKDGILLICKLSEEQRIKLFHD